MIVVYAQQLKLKDLGDNSMVPKSWTLFMMFIAFTIIILKHDLFQLELVSANMKEMFLLHLRRHVCPM